ncbi:MAG TPA: inositol monophosphatase family protein, partial [Armatimonadota bacterium]|nr:inositol monophosphatase family protein [Armatimonadota bacterium]
LAEAGLTSETLAEIDHLLVGCGGFVKELIAYTAGASTVKDDSRQRLSAADELTDRLLREQLLRLIPYSGGYSEEGGAFGTAGCASYVHWLLDPVDGTRPATLGGAFGVSVGALVVRDGAPVAAVGWVYVPTLSALYRGILAPGFTECTLNGRAVLAEADLSVADLAQRYLAVSSDWSGAHLRPSPMKLSAPGATAVHLTQLVHAGSDVAAAVLTRYKPYDAAGGLVIAAAGGCAIYPLHRHNRRPSRDPLEPLSFLLQLRELPDQWACPVLVCTPPVADLLRG